MTRHTTNFTTGQLLSVFRLGSSPTQIPPPTHHLPATPMTWSPVPPPRVGSQSAIRPESAPQAHPDRDLAAAQGVGRLAALRRRPSDGRPSIPCLEHPRTLPSSGASTASTASCPDTSSPPHVSLPAGAFARTARRLATT
jgi:hypothetical protein